MRSFRQCNRTHDSKRSYHWENLDAIDISDDSLNELRDSIAQKYRNQKLDLIVVLGSGSRYDFWQNRRSRFSLMSRLFSVAVCLDQVDRRIPDSRSTGSWFQLDPAKTLNAALRLLPDTQQVFVVAGQSRYDRAVTAFAKTGLNSFHGWLDLTYLTDLPMNELQERLRHLYGPFHRSLSFFLPGRARGEGSSTLRRPFP